MLWTIQRSDSSVSKKKASFKNENSNSNCKCNSNSNSSSRNNTYIYAIIKSNTDSALLTSINSCKWKPSWHSQYSPGMPKTNTRFLWHCQDSQSAFLEDLKMHSPIASLRQPPAVKDAALLYISDHHAASSPEALALHDEILLACGKSVASPGHAQTPTVRSCNPWLKPAMHCSEAAPSLSITTFFSFEKCITHREILKSLVKPYKILLTS